MHEEQVALGVQFTTVFYVIGVLVIMLAVAGVFLLDMGLSRRGNVLHTFTQKLAATFAAAGGMSILGYGIWYWQYNVAFEVPDAFKEAVSGWWLGGENTNTFAQYLDPILVPSADSFLAFVAVFIVFAAFFASLLAGSVIERVKTSAISIVAFVFGAIVIPYGAYLVYGSVGPLSNSGTHEFAGIFFYILLGCWSLVLAWRARPRPGVFDDKGVEPPVAHNLPFALFGMLLLIVALCVYPLINGLLIPDTGYFGIALNETGMGIISINLMMAFIGSVLGGFIVWKISGHPYFMYVSPIAGWIAVSGEIDVVKPWQSAVTALFAPLLVLAGYNLMTKFKLDDPKVVPLTLLPGIYGVLMTAVFASGVKQGGYFGLEGEFALQHASISFGQQLLGVVVFVVGGLLSALIVVLAVEKTIGLREKRIDEGMDNRLDEVLIGDIAYPEGVQAELTAATTLAGVGVIDGEAPSH